MTIPQITTELSDAYNANYFANYYKDKILWCKDLGGWFIFNGKIWSCYGDEYLSTYVSVVAEVMRKEFIENKLTKNFYMAHCNKMLNTSGWKACLESAKAYLAIKTNEFDANSLLFNCQNGTYDLENDVFKSFSPADRMSKICGTDYIKDATCPRFEKFLDEIFLSDKNLISYIQRVMGYSLTASTKEHAMFILYGTGRNGKSLLIETISDVMGDYALNCPSAMLIQKHGNQIPNDVARLKGARFASASETSQSVTLDEELIKQLTGNKIITARFLGKEYFDFQATFKIFLATNHKPNIRGTDTGIWSKIQMIPFLLTLKEEEQDKDLSVKLAQEKAGIFNWMLEGYRNYKKMGLCVPEKVKKATQLYREEEDDIGQFIKDECIEENNGFIPTAEFKKRFFEVMGYHKGQKAISEYMERKGHKPHGDNKVCHNGKYQRGYVRIRWATDIDRTENKGWQE